MEHGARLIPHFSLDSQGDGPPLQSRVVLVVWRSPEREVGAEAEAARGPGVWALRLWEQFQDYGSSRV